MMQATNPQMLLALAQMILGFATVIASIVAAYATWRIWDANKRLAEATERYVKLMAESVEATKQMAEASRRQMEDVEISRRVERARLNAQLATADLTTIGVQLHNPGPEQIQVERIVLKYDDAEISSAWSGSQLLCPDPDRKTTLSWTGDVQAAADKLRKTSPLRGTWKPNTTTGLGSDCERRRSPENIHAPTRGASGWKQSHNRVLIRSRGAPKEVVATTIDILNRRGSFA